MMYGSSQSQQRGPRFGLQKTFLVPSGNVQVQRAAEASVGALVPQVVGQTRAAQGHPLGPADPAGLVADDPAAQAADGLAAQAADGLAAQAVDGLAAQEADGPAAQAADGLALVPTPRQPRTTMSSAQG
jgi:hypothetical protein